MGLIDFHTHSLCSPDGSFPMARMAEAGIVAGLSGLCFTDHWDLIDHRGNRYPTYDWAPVREQFAAAGARCGDRIGLFFGLELGEAPEDFPAAEKGLKAAPELDYVICSVHNMGSDNGGQEFYYCDYRDSLNLCYEHLDIYFQKLLASARWGKFDALGHVTYPLRYMRDRDGQPVDLGRYAGQMDELFHVLADAGRALELNVNRGAGIGDQLPVFRRFRECGGELVTIGSDAHRPEHVGKGVREGYALLKEAGFRYLAQYEKRRPEPVKL
jgi:histidinol-phosphatase (PHP family)